MFVWFSEWRERRILKSNSIDERDWQSVLSQLPLLERLNNEELNRLRDLAVLFIHGKKFVGVQGQVLTGNMALLIALQACLPILNLGIKWYRGWQTILVYPAAFKAKSTEVDPVTGVAREVNHALAGQAWQRGGVILSWNDTVNAGVIDGHNLVIHEFVHKLDMLNGRADGFPPLRHGMSVADWTKSFTESFTDFTKKVAKGSNTTLDRYGATSPAEFIAVVSEVFFETPKVLKKAYPDVYDNLVLFYGQNPMVS